MVSVSELDLTTPSMTPNSVLAVEGRPIPRFQRPLATLLTKNGGISNDEPKRFVARPLVACQHGPLPGKPFRLSSNLTCGAKESEKALRRDHHLVLGTVLRRDRVSAAPSIRGQVLLSLSE